jgi:hypothetical protein
MPTSTALPLLLVNCDWPADTVAEKLALYPHVPKLGLSDMVTEFLEKSRVRLPDANNIPGKSIPSDPVGLVAPISVNGRMPVVGMVAVGVGIPTT